MNYSVASSAEDGIVISFNILLDERSVLVVCVMSDPRHICILWVVKQLSILYSYPLHWDINVVGFARYMVEVVLTTTFLVNEDWWAIQDRYI